MAIVASIGWIVIHSAIFLRQNVFLDISSLCLYSIFQLWQMRLDSLGSILQSSVLLLWRGPF